MYKKVWYRLSNSTTFSLRRCKSGWRNKQELTWSRREASENNVGYVTLQHISFARHAFRQAVYPVSSVFSYIFYIIRYSRCKYNDLVNTKQRTEKTPNIGNEWNFKAHYWLLAVVDDYASYTNFLSLLTMSHQVLFTHTRTKEIFSLKKIIKNNVQQINTWA